MKKITLIIMIMGALIIANAQMEKNELKLTPQITKMLVDTVSSKFINKSDKQLSGFGITNRSQLTNFQFGKSIPMYRIENENLKFIDKWRVLVMSDDEPLFLADVKLEGDGQYIWAGSGGAMMAEGIHNYEHKDLIIGCLGVRSPSGMDYLIIRKENTDIFVQTYDYAAREFFKHEYSFSEIMNLIKQ